MKSGRIKNVYYDLKPFIPRRLQVGVRKWCVKKRIKGIDDSWPIREGNGIPPTEWKGWPDEKAFALVLTHDVETLSGLNKCKTIAKMEMELGFRSSFNFVVKKYRVPLYLIEFLKENNFEIGVHGVYHDGKLLKTREIFKERAKIINMYLNKYNAVGFRSPAMHHNLKWFHELDIEYDMSTFDTDPFEPQPDGVETIYPFWVSNNGGESGYIELPYTLPQDFTLLVLMEEKTTEIWQKKLEWIYKKKGWRF